MSAPKVDVLAVMEKAAKELRHWQRDHGEDIRTKEALAGLREARAAVAELIETQRGCRDALREAAKQFRCLDDRAHADMCDAHADAADAMLARIGGAA